MTDRLEDVKSIADIINKLVIAAAVIIGGGWAFYKYIILESPQGQLATNQLLRICSERGSLDIRIDLTSSDGILLGKVNIKNIGTKVVNMDISGIAYPINIAFLGDKSDMAIQQKSGRMVTEADIQRTFFPFMGPQSGLGRLELLSVLPGRSFELPFVAAAERPGLYLATFNGGRRRVDPDDQVCWRFNEDAGLLQAGASWDWAAAAIHYVQARTIDAENNNIE